MIASSLFDLHVLLADLFRYSAVDLHVFIYLFLIMSTEGCAGGQTAAGHQKGRTTDYRCPFSQTLRFFPTRAAEEAARSAAARALQQTTAFSHSMKIPFPIPFFLCFVLFPFHLISMISSFANHSASILFYLF